jgi:hypothetical protein
MTMREMQMKCKSREETSVLSIYHGNDHGKFSRHFFEKKKFRENFDHEFVVSETGEVL